MKILQINDKLSIDGGAEQYLIDVSQTLEKRGYQVILASEKEDTLQLVKKKNPKKKKRKRGPFFNPPPPGSKKIN